MSNGLQLSLEERKVYDVIKRETMNTGGIKQTLLKKHPDLRDIDPKKISQITKKLIKLNIIKRTVIENGNKRVYMLIAKDSPENLDIEKPITTSYNTNGLHQILLDIPCIKCRHLFLCSAKHAYNPLRCSLIAYFILERSGIVSKT